jgi:hypothetical protein
MLSREEMSCVRRAIQDIRGHLVLEHGKELGNYHFGDCAPGIVWEILSGKSSEEIIAKVDRLISEHYDGPSTARNASVPIVRSAPELNSSQKQKVRLIVEGRLAGGLTVPVGTVCTVEQRYDENDFYGKGRATLDVLKDNALMFTVFEDEVEYLEGDEI